MVDALGQCAFSCPAGYALLLLLLLLLLLTAYYLLTTYYLLLTTYYFSCPAGYVRPFGEPKCSACPPGTAFDSLSQVTTYYLLLTTYYLLLTSTRHRIRLPLAAVRHLRRGVVHLSQR